MSAPAPVQSFSYPFHRRAPWLLGSLLVLVWPLSFPILLGYALSATRRAADDPGAPPPPLEVSRRSLAEGLLLGLAIAALTLPFALLVVSAADLLERAGVLAPYAFVGAGAALSLVWAVTALVILPVNAAAFAGSGRPGDLFNPVAAVRRVRSALVAWNVATVVIVTAWLLAFASACLCCVGFLPGGFYAMLVTAHAIGSLASPETP